MSEETMSESEKFFAVYRKGFLELKTAYVQARRLGDFELASGYAEGLEMLVERRMEDLRGLMKEFNKLALEYEGQEGSKDIWKLQRSMKRMIEIDEHFLEKFRKYGSIS